MVGEKSRVFLELREKKEKQLVDLRAKFKQSFEQYGASLKSEGQYPDLNTSTEVDVYIGSRRDLWNHIQKLDMVLKDVTPVALEVLRELRAQQKTADKQSKE